MSDEYALSLGVKPTAVPVSMGNRTASGTVAREGRANSTSLGHGMALTEKEWKWTHGSPLSVAFVNPDLVPVVLGSTHPESKQDYTSYTITITRGSGPYAESWEIQKRYSDFDELNAHMKSTAKVTLSALPPKSVFNKGKEFINKRRDGLQAYLQVLCAHPVLQHSLVLKKFVDPERYATNPWTEYFTGVGLFIRNSSTWELDERLGRFGWRYNKATAVVKGAGGADAGTPHLLTWTPLGYEVEYMSRELLGRTLHYMAELVHPNVMGAKHGEFCDTEGGATVVIRELCPAGSLKDRICNSSSKKQAAPPHKVNYCPKYGAGSDVGLPIADIQRFGAEILEGLKFLQDKLIPYGQLHTGNVLIKPDGSCALTDLETGLIPGVASIYAPFISELAHVESLQQQDVYAFGHVLYEMSVGRGLDLASTNAVPGGAPGTAVVLSILGSGVKKLPSINALLKDSMFSTQPVSSVAPSFKASARVKEALAAAFAAIEAKHTTAQQVTEKRRRQSKLDDKRAAAAGSGSARLTARLGALTVKQTSTPTGSPLLGRKEVDGGGGGGGGGGSA